MDKLCLKSVSGLFLVCIIKSYHESTKINIIHNTITKTSRVVKINKTEIIPPVFDIMYNSNIETFSYYDVIDTWDADAIQNGKNIKVWSLNKKNWKKDKLFVSYSILK